MALDRFPPAPARPVGGDGSDAANPVMLLSVGRAVAKKGYEDLLTALAQLPRELAWRLVHIGGGALAGKLKAEADRLGIADRIDWRGARPQPEVLAAYREADIFVLAAKIAPDGDRDGLPNVLVEAQSQGVPCISTQLSGIPELVENGVTGLLVTPGDRKGLTEALAALIRDPMARQRLGAAGAVRVRATFDADTTIEALACRFGIRPSEAATPAREPALADAS